MKLELLLLGCFKLQFHFQCLWLVCLYVLFLPRSSLTDCTFLRIFSISSWLSILSVYSCPQYSLMILAISVELIVTSAFSLLILLIWVLFHFFLMSLAKRLSVVFIFTKNNLLVSLLQLFSLLPFHLFVLWILWFLLLTLGFICSFCPSCFGCKFKLLIWYLFIWGEILLL